MNFSIGGYSIRNYSPNEDGTYIVELFKKEVRIATVNDMGDGFVDIDLEPIPDEQNETYYKFILDDMYNLTIELQSILQEDAKYKRFLHSTYTAVHGFVRLLIDFKGLVDVYNEVQNKQDTDYYIVGSLGHSYFTNDSANHKRTYFWMYALTHDYAEADKTLRAHTARRKQLDGDLVSAAILSGEMGWNLSFQDYGELYNP